MRTEFSNDNKVFTDRCHRIAQKVFYPKLFNRGDLQFIDTSLDIGETQKILDGKMAIDKIVRVSCGYGAPINFTIQERFREPKYRAYKDITITEWNKTTNVPGELYKLYAGIFVYGYAVDVVPSDLSEVIAIDVPKLLTAIANSRIRVIRSNSNPRSKQNFVTLKFSDLHTAGVVLYHYNT